MKIEELGLSPRTEKLLRQLGIETAEELANTGRGVISCLRGIGKSALTEIEDKLKEHGLTLED